MYMCGLKIQNLSLSVLLLDFDFLAVNPVIS